jgi:hypothetical protein
MNILKNSLISYVLDAVGASSSIDSNSTRLDMQGYDGVVFITLIADSVTSGVATLNVQGSAADSDTAMATITGASATKTCVSSTDIDNTLLIVDVFRPLLRYVQGNVTSSAANIAFSHTIAIRYCGSKFPITQGGTVSASTSVVGS